jgi:FlaA1/EpsC-like NDP-sugar epimerase
VFAAVDHAQPGEIYVPKVAAANVYDVAVALIGDRKIDIKITGIRPGEKIHEIMVSEEECHRTYERGGYYVIGPILPELRREEIPPALDGEYSSAKVTLTTKELVPMLEPYVKMFAQGALT